MATAEQLEHYRTIDTILSEKWQSYYAERTTLASLEKLLKQAEAWQAQPTRYRDQTERLAGLKVQVKLSRDFSAALARAAIAYNEANYTGWSRFYLVQHIHKSMRCSSFRPTTRVGWLPAVSGLTEVEAVAEYGETLCTICYPDAPTALTTKKVDPLTCPGSGKYIPRDQTSGGRGKYATCPECGEFTFRTSTGVLRKHKRAA